MSRRRSAARGLLVSGALVACSVDPRAEEKTAHVTLASLADGKADAVFGQKDLNSAGAPTKVTSVTVTRPQGIAMHRGDPGFLAIADTGSNRVFEITEPLFGFTSFLQGQVDYASALPNQGRATPLFGTLSGPTAVAKNFNLTAIADSGNHRVIVDWSVGAPHDVLGQSGSGATAIPNRFGVGADSLDSPRGVAFLQGDQLYLFVADTGNHRLLGYDINAVGAARFVVGQDSFTTNGANKGATFADADRLSSPRGLAAFSNDGSGTAPPPEVGIYVADTANHRVLHFPWCVGFERGSGPCPRADRVWGQPDFVHGRAGIGPDRLDSPSAVVVDRNRGIWVADTGNHRVLHFKRTATKADVVLGQPDFTTRDAPTRTSATTLNAPIAIVVSPANGDLYVADEADSRILRYAFVHGPDECDDDDPCTIDAVTIKGCTHKLTPNTPECFPFACDLNTRACAKDCSSFGCQAPYVCVTGSSFGGGRCVQPCGVSSECRKGTCADGWCCDAACTGRCESCSQSGREGICAPIFGDPSTFKLATCAGEGQDSACAGECSGFDVDQCTPAPKGKSCGIIACVGGVATGDATCDGAGGCVQVSTPCFPYACDAARCRTACFGDLHCADGARCIDGACVENAKAIVPGGGCGLSSGAEATSFGLPLALAAAFAARRRRVRARVR